MNTEEKIISEFVQNALYRLDESTRMVTIAMEKLSEEQIWKRFNASSNSVGNLILHLCGNIRQYAISSLGARTDIRQREEEFSAKSGDTKAQLLQKLNDTVEEAKSIIRSCPMENWIERREVQCYVFSGIGVVLHVVEHYSYHTGQIAFWTKQLIDGELGFYEGVDLTKKNKE